MLRAIALLLVLATPGCFADSNASENGSAEGTSDSVHVTATQVSKEPNFEDVAHFTSSTVSEDIPGTSCDCVENGNCSSIRVQFEPGFYERQNESCNWNRATERLDCTYDKRFVRRVPPLPSSLGEPEELPPVSEWREVPGEWRSITISAKRLETSNGTREWCTVPTNGL